jgi:hypothetical protein
MIGNQVGGPGDYLPTEQLAADSLVEHSFWVYNKVRVVTPLSTWARHNCDAVTTGTGGTLGYFTWFCCTSLDSHRVRYCGPVPGSGIDRNNSLASRSQAYAPDWLRVELSRC